RTRWREPSTSPTWRASRALWRGTIPSSRSCRTGGRRAPCGPSSGPEAVPQEKLVLAYSGGLDTSVAIHWLRERGHDVVALTIDLGEKKDLDAIQRRALQVGASAAYVVDGKVPFVRDFLWPSLQAGAVYEKEYPLATA